MQAGHQCKALDNTGTWTAVQALKRVEAHAFLSIKHINYQQTLYIILSPPVLHQQATLKSP